MASATRDALGCLVLDVQLPGISGLDLQQKLASSDAQIPIIFITGHGDIPMSVRAIKAGALEIETLQGYDWPGNIRELRNVIERAVIFARGGALEFDVPGTGSPVDLTSFERLDVGQAEPEYLTESEMRRRERENLFVVLQRTGWKIKGVDGAAELLGL